MKGKNIKIDSLDHLVLTVKDINASCEFCSRALGMESITFGQNRKALKFGIRRQPDRIIEQNLIFEKMPATYT